MFKNNIPDGASLFLGGAIAILLSWITSGCRTGNYVERAASQPVSRKTGTDRISGYYVAQPQSLNFYATTDQTTQKSAPVTSIPQEIAQFISNPLALILQNSATGLAGLTSPTGKQALPIYVNSDNTLSYHGKTSSFTYWQDSSCQGYLEISESGRRIETSEVDNPPGNSLPLSGKLELKIQVINQFEGNCVATLELMEKCYQDVTQCGGQTSTENQSLQDTVTVLLGPWIESSALSPSEISHLVNYAYEVSYE